MIRRYSMLVVIFIFMASCSTLLVPHGSTYLEPAKADLVRANKLFQEDKYDDAILAYRRALKNKPDEETAANAQYGIAYTLVYCDNPDRAYTVARVEFKKFITLYPKDPRYQEARSWYLALKAFCDTKQEKENLNKDIEQLKQLDIRREEMKK